MFAWLLAFLLSICGMFYILNKTFPDVLANQQNYLYILQMFLILSVVFISVWRRNVNWKFVFTSTMSWIGIALILITGYSYKYELRNYYQNIVGQIFPSLASESADGSVVFHSSSDGHFQIAASVNGTRVTFLVDTGATKVALTDVDAKRIGIDMSNLTYNVSISTANGVSLFAPIVINKIQVGSIVIQNVSGYVGKPGTLDTSLLGMSFLRQLSSYQVTKDTLVLRQ